MGLQNLKGRPNGMMRWFRVLLSNLHAAGSDGESAVMSSRLGSGIHTLFFFAVFASIVAAYAVWSGSAYNSQSCDAAYNQILGLQALQAIRHEFTVSGLISLCGHHPPLYCLQEALVFLFLGSTPYIALLSNAPGLFLMGYGTYRIALRLMAPGRSLLAGSLVLLLPMVAWSNHGTLVDVPLAGWVACSILLLIKTEGLQRKGYSLLFGVSAAAGMLTMWTYSLAMIFPTLWILLRAPNRRRAAENCLDSIFVALLGTLWWYLPNIRGLSGFAVFSEAATAFQRDPTLDRAGAWNYDFPGLLCWWLSMILCLLIAWMLVRSRRAGLSYLPPPIQLVILWLAGALMIWPLHSISHQDYMVPIAAPISILMVYLWGRSRRTMASLAVTEILLAIFAMVPLPTALEKPATLSPEHEDRQYSQIISVLQDGGLVGFLPRLPRFHAAGLQLAAMRLGRKLNVYQLGCVPAAQEDVALMTHVVTKSNDPGSPCRTKTRLPTMEAMMKLGWTAKRFARPDGTQVQVWSNPAPLDISSDELDRWQGRLGYLILSARLARLTKEIIPDRDSVLVVCNGDDDLIRRLGPNFHHFPQSEDGGYAGYYPSDGSEAVADLKRLEFRGAEYIIFPQTSSWWLDYYSELKDYLDLNSQTVFKSKDLAVVYHLKSGPG